MRDELRDDQREAMGALRTSIGNGKRRIVMQAPTGFGKTILAAAIVEAARAKSKKVLFTVPALSLIDQVVEMFYSQGLHDIGVIQAQHRMTDWSKPVQVASVQTLQKRELPDYDLAIVDECHKVFQYYGKWFTDERFKAKPIIGLSATPWTKGLGNLYDDFIRGSTTHELIERGRLAPFMVYAPTHVDLRGVRTVAGDYDEAELSARMSSHKVVGDAVETWLRLGENRATLCYAVDRAHAKHLQARFEAAGVACGYQDADTRDDERRAIKRAFHDGTTRVVVSVGTLTIGIDWDVRCISMCRPTQSDMLFVQIVGRGLRTAEGKDHCLILDHSDNHQRLGFVTDIDASFIGLRGGKMPAHSIRTDNIPLPKECPKCAYLKPPKTATCAACGFTATVQNKVKAFAGDLRELQPKPPKPMPTIFDKETFLAELRCYAILENYKQGWAARQFYEKFGSWPSKEMEGVAPARSISPEVRNWIKHRMIAYFKGKAAGRAAQPVQNFVR